MSLSVVEQQYWRLDEKRRERERRLSQLETERSSAEAQRQILVEAQDVTLAASQWLHQRLEFCITSIVTEALKTVFDEPYDFELRFSSRGNKSIEVRPVLVRDGEEFDPMDACGGGVVDIVSFGLRLACLLISNPQPDKVLVLDEPFRFVSRDLQDLVREMLDRLSEELKIQFIIVTHETDLIE